MPSPHSLFLELCIPPCLFLFCRTHSLHPTPPNRFSQCLANPVLLSRPTRPPFPQHLHGKMLQHPFQARTIPVICDPVLVDMSFGTGAVKVTPAHDPNDLLSGRRHGYAALLGVPLSGLPVRFYQILQTVLVALQPAGNHYLY